MKSSLSPSMRLASPLRSVSLQPPAISAYPAALFHAPALRTLRSVLMRSAIADVAGNLRDHYRLLRCAYRQPESLGMASNDQLASWLVSRLCRPGAVLVDVGAHVGSVVGATLRNGRGVRIIAIEAIEDKAAFLRETFPQVQVHHCAAGAQDGSAAFFVHRTLTAYSSLGKPARGTSNDIDEVMVPMRALDSLIRPHEVDVIKIDVEGAELGVLQGAEGLLKNCRPIIMFESGPAHDDGLEYSKEGLWNFLNERKYGIYVPNRVPHHGRPLSCGGFTDSHDYPRRTTNYFAIPHERRDAVRQRARQLLDD
jgi:FkbM family methyltransferase